MTFSERPFVQRLGDMGDEAEGVFMNLAPFGKFERFGWNRPEVSMANMEAEIRYKPDFYTQTGLLVEVMGCGKDNTIKLKVDKYEAMKWWNNKQSVALFLWNSARSEYCILKWDMIKIVVRTARTLGERVFSDGNVYLPIEWDSLPATVPYDG